MPRLSEGSIQKEASALVYLQEELTDARMRCDQLKRYIAEAVKLINKSDKRDHFYEVAGNLLYGIPTAMFKLDKALDATALAASRMDYEELKSNLKPEKVTELEEVLDDVRIRRVDHRSAETHPNREKTAMRKFKAASQSRIASALRRIAGEVEAGAIPPVEVNRRLRNVLMACATTADQAVQATWPQMADSREEVMDGFKKNNPDLSDADLNEIADQWEKNKNVVKDKSAASMMGWTLARRVREMEAELYGDFLKEVNTWLRSMEPSAKVEVNWVTKSAGFKWLNGTVTGKTGKTTPFSFLPEEPKTAASEILYEFGDYLCPAIALFLLVTLRTRCPSSRRESPLTLLRTCPLRTQRSGRSSTTSTRTTSRPLRSPSLGRCRPLAQTLRRLTSGSSRRAPQTSISSALRFRRTVG